MVLFATMIIYSQTILVSGVIDMTDLICVVILIHYIKYSVRQFYFIPYATTLRCVLIDHFLVLTLKKLYTINI